MLRGREAIVGGPDRLDLGRGVERLEELDVERGSVSGLRSTSRTISAFDSYSSSWRSYMRVP
jgi:hypothetical protein